MTIDPGQVWTIVHLKLNRKTFQLLSQIKRPYVRPLATKFLKCPSGPLTIHCGYTLVQPPDSDTHHIYLG